MPSLLERRKIPKNSESLIAQYFSQFPEQSKEIKELGSLIAQAFGYFHKQGVTSGIYRPQYANYVIYVATHPYANPADPALQHCISTSETIYNNGNISELIPSYYNQFVQIAQNHLQEESQPRSYLLRLPPGEMQDMVRARPMTEEELNHREDLAIFQITEKHQFHQRLYDVLQGLMSGEEISTAGIYMMHNKMQCELRLSTLSEGDKQHYPFCANAHLAEQTLYSQLQNGHKSAHVIINSPEVSSLLISLTPKNRLRY